MEHKVVVLDPEKWQLPLEWVNSTKCGTDFLILTVTPPADHPSVGIAKLWYELYLQKSIVFPGHVKVSWRQKAKDRNPSTDL